MAGKLTKGRETLYLSIAETQRDSDAFMRHYNIKRSHQACRLNGQTPTAALRAALGIEQLPSLDLQTAAPDIAITESEAAADTVDAEAAPRRRT